MNEAYDKVERGDVRFRDVINLASFKSSTRSTIAAASVDERDLVKLLDHGPK
jgi:hypothetical protein